MATPNCSSAVSRPRVRLHRLNFGLSPAKLVLSSLTSLPTRKSPQKTRRTESANGAAADPATLAAAGDPANRYGTEPMNVLLHWNGRRAAAAPVARHPVSSVRRRSCHSDQKVDFAFQCVRWLPRLAHVRHKPAPVEPRSGPSSHPRQPRHTSRLDDVLNICSCFVPDVNPWA